MKTNFLKYNWEQLLEEDSFLSWVIRNKDNDKWEKFVASHPGFKIETDKARKVIAFLHDKYEVLDEASVQKLWTEIQGYEKQEKNITKRFFIAKGLVWAASVLLVIALGTVTLLKVQKGNGRYEFQNGYDIFADNSSITMPSGEKIFLYKKFSKIIVSENIIIDDSILIPEVETRNEMNELNVPYGRTAEILLADGTVIWLNSGSRIAFPASFSGDARTVYFEGEACFQVGEDKSIPFFARSGEIDIQVHGTLFNVSAYLEQQTIQTVLIEGTVSLVKNGIFKNNTIEISPNQKAEFNKFTKEISIVNEPDARNYMAWIHNWLEYKRESLNSVLVKLQRHYNVSFHLPKDFPADDKISGKLDLRMSLEQVMMILSDATAIDYNIIGKEVFISKK